MALYSNGSIGLRILLRRLRLIVWSFIVTGVVQWESGRGVIDTTQYRFSYVCLEKLARIFLLFPSVTRTEGTKMFVVLLEVTKASFGTYWVKTMQ